MTIQERVESIVDSKVQRIMDLFHDDRTSIDLSNLNNLLKLHPLLESIKDEVKQLQNSVDKLKPSKEDEEDKDDNPEEDEDLTPEEEHRIRKFLEDLTKNLRLLGPNTGNYLPEGPTPRQLPDFSGKRRIIPDWMNILWYLYNLVDDVKDGIIKELSRDQAKRNLDFIKSQLVNLTSQVWQITDDVNHHVTEEADSIRSALKDVNDLLELCCQSTGQGVQDLKDGQDDIKRLIQTLDPAKLASQELNILSQTKNIRIATTALRRRL